MEINQLNIKNTHENLSSKKAKIIWKITSEISKHTHGN